MVQTDSELTHARALLCSSPPFLDNRVNSRTWSGTFKSMFSRSVQIRAREVQLGCEEVCIIGYVSAVLCSTRGGLSMTRSSSLYQGLPSTATTSEWRQKRREWRKTR